jgi:hypothetical protein
MKIDLVVPHWTLERRTVTDLYGGSARIRGSVSPCMQAREARRPLRALTKGAVKYHFADLESVRT